MGKAQSSPKLNNQLIQMPSKQNAVAVLSTVYEQTQQIWLSLGMSLFLSSNSSNG